MARRAGAGERMGSFILDERCWMDGCEGLVDVEVG